MITPDKHVTTGGTWQLFEDGPFVFRQDGDDLIGCAITRARIQQTWDG